MNASSLLLALARIFLYVETQYIFRSVKLTLESASQVGTAGYSASLTLDNMYRISTYEKILAKSESSGA